MSKIRINDLARELEVKSKEILDVLTTVGVTEKKTHSSSLEDHEAELVRKTSSRPLRRGAEFGEDFACRSRRRRDQDQDRPLAYLAAWRRAARHHAAKGSSRTSRGASGSQDAGCDASDRSEGGSSGRSRGAAKAVPPKPAVRSSCACAADTETGDAGFGSGRASAAGGGRDSAQSSRDATRRDRTGFGFIRLAARHRLRSLFRRGLRLLQRTAGSAPPAAQPPATE